MNTASPAIVAQKSVRPMPRWALLLLCAAYVLPGFVGRQPWKKSDIEALGFMLQLAHPATGEVVHWLRPTLLGQVEPNLALLPTWLGAVFIQLAPSGWEALAARLPFMGMLLLTLLATWHAVTALARTPAAQPVAFAFGGEAHPRAYARTLADGALLALMACLGLAQLSHETSAALAQLCSTALLLHGLSTLHLRHWLGRTTLVTGLLGLALSGAPTMALLLATGGMALSVNAREATGMRRASMLEQGLLALLLLLTITLSGALDLWRWRLDPLTTSELKPMARILLWFTWPAGALAVWSIWRWRRQLHPARVSLHIGLPLWFTLVTVGTTLATGLSDRALLAALPGIAALAAFALPTLRRSVGAFIDWFTLLFFSLGALVITVVWLAMTTGWPAVTARNVVRTAPDYVHQPGWGPLLLAVLTAVLAWLAWLWLVRWRTARHRVELWKSMVLPAAGTTLCWLLLTTLWLPLLDHALGYEALVNKVKALQPPTECVQSAGLSNAQNAALLYHGHWRLQAPGEPTPACRWLVIDQNRLPHWEQRLRQWGWQEQTRLRKPSSREETLVVFLPASR